MHAASEPYAVAPVPLMRLGGLVMSLPTLSRTPASIWDARRLRLATTQRARHLWEPLTRPEESHGNGLVPAATSGRRRLLRTGGTASARTRRRYSCPRSLRANNLTNGDRAAALVSRVDSDTRERYGLASRRRRLSPSRRTVGAVRRPLQRAIHNIEVGLMKTASAGRSPRGGMDAHQSPAPQASAYAARFLRDDRALIRSGRLRAIRSFVRDRTET